jgi:hypothetical protein
VRPRRGSHGQRCCFGLWARGHCIAIRGRILFGINTPHNPQSEHLA